MASDGAGMKPVLVQHTQSDGAGRPPTLSPGEMIGNRYLIEGELGRGGIGVVYLARDQKLHGARVVIKLLLESPAGEQHRAWVEKKFGEEIRALARISHPGVVAALDVGELTDGRPFFVMQYVSGLSLQSVIEPHGIELDRAASIIGQIGQALSAAHEQGVLHRDLKPENIMLESLRDQEHVRLIDFGIASVLDSSEPLRTTAIAGTASYMAPEQLRGKPRIASDVYAMGVIAYEMITGRLPFAPRSPYQLLDLQRAGVKTKPSELRPELTPQAEEIMLRALAFLPEDRYQSARQFGSDLADALRIGRNAADSITGEAGGDDASRLSPTEVESKAAKPMTRKIMILACAVIALMLAGLAAWRYLAADPETTPEQTLSYSLIMQKDPARYPQSPLSAVSDETVFEPGDHLRLNVTSSQNGFLYIINERPVSSFGLPLFNILFPSGDSAEVRADQEIRIPDPSGWFVFDEEQGTEKIWIVCSRNEIVELEAVKARVNRRDQGVISLPTEVRSVADFLASLSTSQLRIRKNDSVTTLSTTGDVVAGVVKLDHRGTRSRNSRP
jgi:serine/threonine protein kinase